MRLALVPGDGTGVQTGPSTLDWGNGGQVFAGSGWALQKLGRAATEVGESWLRAAFSSHRGAQDHREGAFKDPSVI